MAVFVAILVSLYAVLSAGALATIWALRRHDSSQSLGVEISPPVRVMLASYAPGAGLGVWIASVGLASAAAALIWLKSAAAPLVFAAAVALDLALYFTWRDRRAYVETLTPAERLGEALQSFLVLCALLSLAWLSHRGALG
jgi:hypothetical protein